MTELAPNTFPIIPLIGFAFGCMLIFEEMKGIIGNLLIRLAAAFLYSACAFAAGIIAVEITAAIAFWLAG